MAQNIYDVFFAWEDYWYSNEWEGGFGRIVISGTYFGTNDDDGLRGSSGDDIIYCRDDSDEVFGRLGGDVIYGEEGADLIKGDQDLISAELGGNDTLIGGNGDDLLAGGAGNDVLRGDAGDDLIIGGAGVDTLDWSTAVSNGSVSLDVADVDTQLGRALSTGPDGLQELDLIGQVENVIGSGFKDLIIGSAVANILEGMDGDDRVYGRVGDDDLYGDAGNDILEGGAGSDALSGAQDNDTLRGQAGIDFLHGEDGIDLLDGGTERDLLYGGQGNDTILAGAGNDNLEGGEGDDGLDGGDGNDVLRGQGGYDSLSGGSGNDLYLLDSTSNRPGSISTSFYYDTVQDTGGIDAVQVARGVKSIVFDTYYTSYSLALGIENATIVGSGAFDLLGNSLNNSLVGNASANVLSGGDGNDYLNAGDGLDTLVGGNGNDTYVLGGTSPLPFSLNWSYDSVSEAAAGGVDTVLVSRGLKSTAPLTDFTSYTLGAHVENGTITGAASLGAFDVIGNGLSNTLLGNSGQNALMGRAGDDHLDGKGGADTLYGGGGNDTYVLGSTSEFFRYDGVIENENGGTDTVVVNKARATLFADHTSYTLGTNIENGRISSAGEFDLRGNDLSNVLFGGSGSNDLIGGGGADTLVGSFGNDVLEGGIGFDTLSGGVDGDTFLWRSLSEMGTTAAATDRVEGFSRAQGDRLDLALIDAVAGTGNQFFSFEGTGAFTRAGEVRFQKSGGDTLILLNTDGDGSAEGVIRLTGVHDVEADWFSL